MAELSDRTGLSQSQIYKWWWDQKKKSSKMERDHLGRMKNKPIKKDRFKRFGVEEDNLDFSSYELEQEEPMQTKVKKYGLEEPQET